MNTTSTSFMIHSKCNRSNHQITHTNTTSVRRLNTPNLMVIKDTTGVCPHGHDIGNSFSRGISCADFLTLISYMDFCIYLDTCWIINQIKWTIYNDGRKKDKWCHWHDYVGNIFLYRICFSFIFLIKLMDMCHLALGGYCTDWDRY